MTIVLLRRGAEIVPMIKGTRIRVADVGIECEYLGKTPDQVVQAHPHLSLAQVHEALSYFYHHIREMRNKIQSDREYTSKMKLRHPTRLSILAS